jgi:glycosyltransferase involved in cell wall biosynthesis
MKRIFDYCISDECVNYYRSILPVFHCRYDLLKEGIDVTLSSYFHFGDWKAYDTFIFHRDLDPGILVYADLLKANGKKIVWELDDDLWAYPGMLNPNDSKSVVLSRLDAIRELADIIVVSSQELFETVHAPRRTIVLPNLIDPGSMIAGLPRNKPLPKKLVVLWQGSISIAEDYDGPSEAILKLAPKYEKEVRFVLWGPVPENVLEAKLPNVEKHDIVPFADYHHMLNQFHADISIASRCEHLFNYSKSPIKWYESSATGAATIASNMVIYRDIRHGTDGLLAGSPCEWEEHLEHLILDHRLRNQLAQTAWHRVFQEFSWNNKEAKELWLEAFQVMVQ